MAVCVLGVVSGWRRVLERVCASWDRGRNVCEEMSKTCGDDKEGECGVWLEWPDGRNAGTLVGWYRERG